jgi:hypothetical protein
MDWTRGNDQLFIRSQLWLCYNDAVTLPVPTTRAGVTHSPSVLDADVQKAVNPGFRGCRQTAAARSGRPSTVGDRSAVGETALCAREAKCCLEGLRQRR